MTTIEDGPGIHVIEATYGWNCRDIKPPMGKNTVRRGNATRKVKKICNGQMRGEVSINTYLFGDPANSCGKEFYIKWRSGKEKKQYEVLVDGEAHGKTVLLTCPAEKKIYSNN